MDKSKTMHNLNFFYLNGNPTDDEALISNSFNNYFIHVGPRLAQHIQSHIKDLDNVSENLFSILFADDTTVLIEGTNINTMITSLNCELAKLTELLNANKLSINVSKSHYMVFHRSRRKINKGNILLDTSILSHVTFTKFLGIIIDDKLKWTHHIAYIKNNL